MSAELQQMHMRNAFTPLDPATLTPKQKSQTLESHLFLKEKRDSTVKGRMVAGGNKQRSYTPKEEATSPTAALESVMLTATIDAEEGRDVAIVDLPNAFIQTDVGNEMITMRLRGKLAELMVKIAPEIYKSYVTLDAKGNMVLYVQLQKAVYSLMKAALMFYLKLSKALKSIGFVINPYNPCVANSIINGKQMTVVWHVDDMKVFMLTRTK